MFCKIRGHATPPPPPSLPPHTHTFLRNKKERVSKQKLSKGCHQGQNIIVLAILERLEFENFFLSGNHGDQQYFSVFHGPPTLKSISPALIIQCLS